MHLLRSTSTPDQWRQQQPRLVIVDDNMYYRSMRHDLFQLARHHGLAYLQLLVACDPTVAAARNGRRSGAACVPEAAFQRMVQGFETPQPCRFEWEAATLTIDTTPSAEVDVAALWGSIWRAWGPAPEMPLTAEESARRREAGQAANAASIMHGLDLRTRKAVGESVARVAGRQRAAVAQRLNALRKELLERARAETVKISLSNTSVEPRAQGSQAPGGQDDVALALHAMEVEFLARCQNLDVHQGQS
jgi:O-phosphoseryl-tRNA(Sec) kinase